MKNIKKSKIILSLFIVIAMIMTNTIYIVSASEVAPDGAQVTDMYSSWATWDIVTAENIYRLGGAGTYSNYRGSFTDTKFAPVYESLNEKFGTDCKPEIVNKDAVTRGEIVSALYGIIAEVLELAEDVSAIDYFVESGLIKGRINGDYQLDQKCTTEEMIIFSVRAYEHLSYELGFYSSGLFWKITGKDLPNTVYLLGTVHVGESSVYPLSKAIISAFDNAAYLAVEANTYTMSEEDQAYIVQSQFITDGSTIKDYISEETYEIYIATMEKLGIAAEIYDYLKPWSAMLYITDVMRTAGEGEDSGAEGSLGMDMYLLMKAFNFSKDVIEVESVKYQMDMFNSWSEELQEMLLLSVIAPPPAEEGEAEMSAEEMAKMVREYTDSLVDAVKSGDEAALTEMLLASRDYSDPLMKEYNTNLWDIRDAAMAETIEQFLNYEDADGDFFVAVGAGHTVGETGIVNVLTEKGYTVERIK